MQRVPTRMAFAFGEIEFAFLKRCFGFRVFQARRGFRTGNAGKLFQELATPLRDELCEFGIVIGKIKKRCRGCEFLALKQHGRAGAEQE